MIKSGVTYKIIHDPGTESVRYVIDASTGVIAQEIDYDEFGNMTLNTDPSFQPLGYAGGLYDSHTKLVKFGARDYDPVIGRWLTKDPIGFAGRDMNLYAYVGGNPMSYIDPSGLVDRPMKEPPAGSGGGAACNPGPFTPNEAALIELAKEAKRRGQISRENAETLLKWANELVFKGPARIDPAHLGTKTNFIHLHLGPVKHLPVK